MLLYSHFVYIGEQPLLLVLLSQTVLVDYFIDGLVCSTLIDWRLARLEGVSVTPILSAVVFSCCMEPLHTAVPCSLTLRIIL